MNFEMRLASRALLDRVVAMVRDEVMPMIATRCCTAVRTCQIRQTHAKPRLT